MILLYVEPVDTTTDQWYEWHLRSRAHKKRKAERAASSVAKTAAGATKQKSAGPVKRESARDRRIVEQAEGARGQIACQHEEIRGSQFSKALLDMTETKVAALREQSRAMKDTAAAKVQAQAVLQQRRDDAASSSAKDQIRHEKVKMLYDLYTSQDRNLSPSKALEKAEDVARRGE